MADFQKAQTTFDQMWTFTRASEATYFDDAGILQTVGNDVARITSEGLLMEAASTNELPQSQNFVTAEWNGVGSPIRSMNEIGIDGQPNTAATLTDNSTTFTAFYNDDVTVPDDSNPAVGSIFIKKTTGQAHAAGVNLLYLNGTTTLEAKYFFDTNNGTFTQASDSPDALDSHSAELIGDFWRLNLVLSNNSTGNTTLSIRIYPAIGLNGINVPDLTITGSNIFAQAQIELNRTKASTPIITAGAAGTRADDDCESDVSWFNSDGFTLIGEYESTFDKSKTNSRYISIDDDAGVENISVMDHVTGTKTRCFFDPGSGITIDFDNTDSVKFAMAYRADSGVCLASVNGLNLSGVVIEPFDSISKIRLCWDSAKTPSFKPESAIIKRVEFFPFAMTEQELIELTS